jgi:hypothetical protein
MGFPFVIPFAIPFVGNFAASTTRKLPTNEGLDEVVADCKALGGVIAGYRELSDHS